MIRQILRDKTNVCHVHVINLCEVFYDFRRRCGETAAQQAIEALLSLGLITRNDIDFDFWQQAGRYKADLRRISLADCFCISLTQRLGGSVVTADHHEFDTVAEQGIVLAQPAVFG
jgi:PIN domain nuclease of toxin-antitoxin system